MTPLHFDIRLQGNEEYEGAKNIILMPAFTREEGREEGFLVVFLLALAPINEKLSAEIANQCTLECRKGFLHFPCAVYIVDIYFFFCYPAAAPAHRSTPEHTGAQWRVSTRRGQHSRCDNCVPNAIST